MARHRIHQAGSPVVHQRLQMGVAGGIALRLPVLGHNVAHIELQGVRLDDGLRYPLHQQMGITLV